MKYEDLDLEQCEHCEFKYPSEILKPIVSSDGRMSQVCGICALQISNEYLGINRKKFDGEIAEEMRLDAIEWRKNRQLTE